MDLMSALELQMQGHFDAPKPTGTEPQPMVGDAVILTGEWSIANAGEIGIIDGIVGRAPEELEITFRYSCYRDDHYVSCSGGPGTIGISAKLLKPTGRKITINCWKFPRIEVTINGKKTFYTDAGAGKGVHYTMEVPLWEWDGKE